MGRVGLGVGWGGVGGMERKVVWAGWVRRAGWQGGVGPEVGWGGVGGRGGSGWQGGMGGVACVWVQGGVGGVGSKGRGGLVLGRRGCVRCGSGGGDQ